MSMAMASLSPPPVVPPPASSCNRGFAMEIVCCPFPPLSAPSRTRRTAFGSSSLFRLIKSRNLSYLALLKDNNVSAAPPALQTHSLTSPSLSQRYDVSGLAGKGHCIIIWSVEADIEDGFVLYVTGDPIPLGCWHPNLAVPLSRSLHTANLWETQLKVLLGINFKYNYIIRRTSSAIEWRPGPEYSLSIPFTIGEDEVIRIRDCWLHEPSRSYPVPSWGSWLTDYGFTEVSLTHPVQPAVSPGQHEVLENQNGTAREYDQITIQTNGSGCIDSSSSKIQREKNGPIEEPWIIDSTVLELSPQLAEQTEVKVSQTDYSSSSKIQREKDCPTEEPWLLDSAVLEQSPLHAEQTGVDVLRTDAVVMHPQREVDAGSTVILVNSSACTMQRIAILEGGNLVELLLEPVQNEVQVKTKAQVDSIYLGVVTNLVPHIGGAFVDIGIKKPSYMAISPYRKPFVYPTDEKEEEREEEFGEDAEAVDVDIVEPVLDPLQGGNNRNKRNQWVSVKDGTKIIVQVVKEQLHRKGPSLTPYPTLRSRFWVLKTRSDIIDVSNITDGSERNLLKVRAKMLQPPGFGLTVRTAAEGHSLEELQLDLDGLLLIWKEITERAKSSALAADEGVEGAVPVMLHRALGQTLSVVQDIFNEKVKSMVVDSPRVYDEVIGYLKKVAPELCRRVELYDKRTPIFDEFKIEEEINDILSKRVALPNGGSLVIEQTEALVSIDVNAGPSVFGEENSAESSALDVNLCAAKQVARELRLRDIGGIIVVNFVDMHDSSSKWKVYEEMAKAVKHDRSIVHVHELSDLSLMALSRQRVRPSVSFMITEPCTCCQGVGRVEALEIFYMKIENEIRRFLAKLKDGRDPGNPKTWPKVELQVDEHMNYYLTTANNAKLAVLSVSLNVHLSLKLVGTFPRGKFELVRLSKDKKEINKKS